jgi:hypothetical protein
MSNSVDPMSFLAGTEKLGFRHEGWVLDQAPADGDRFFRARVVFSRPFRNAPLVHLGVSGFDISNQDAARLRASAMNITPEGFEVVLTTWFDTRLWWVDVNWLAIGAQ